MQWGAFVQGRVKNNTEVIVEILFEMQFVQRLPNQVDLIRDRLRELHECLRGLEEKVINPVWGRVFGVL